MSCTRLTPPHLATCLTLVAALLATAPARAQASPATAEATGGWRWSVSAFGGWASVREDAVLGSPDGRTRYRYLDEADALVAGLRLGSARGPIGWSLQLGRSQQTVPVEDVDVPRPDEVRVQREQWSLDASVEGRFLRSRAWSVVAFGGLGLVDLRATDAEEFETADGRAASLHVGVATERALGSRGFLRLDLRMRWTDGGDSDADREATVGFGWRFGATGAAPIE